MTKPFINIDEVELNPRPATFAPSGPAAERFDARIGPIGSRIGARKLGYNLTAVPPGKRAFPRHNHHVNEEMFFILQGSGELRIGEARYPVRSGDVIACPPGGREAAHQITNTGTEELRYLAVSTAQLPELCEYPDSGKFGFINEWTDPGGEARRFGYFGREEDARGYWDGE
ncbi:cupin domain-containing protein [Endothiovibrio diazotrophicus]